MAKKGFKICFHKKEPLVLVFQLRDIGQKIVKGHNPQGMCACSMKALNNYKLTLKKIFFFKFFRRQ